MKIYRSLFILAVFFILVNPASAKTAESQEKKVTVLSREENLISSEIYREGYGAFRRRWCGNRGLMSKARDSGVELVDFQTKERIKLDLIFSDTLLGCTFDGKKLLYLDAKSERFIDEIEEEESVEIFPGIYSWFERTYDMYVYDITTHEKTIVASVHSASDNVLSPDGTKLLLGRRHRLTSRKDGLEWEDVWFTKKWFSSRGAQWLKDSTGFLTFAKEYSNILCVELFGKDGWARCFDLKVSANWLKTDGEGNIYFLEIHTMPERYILNRCEIKERELSCERILEDYDVFRTYDVLPDGDIIFTDYVHDECIRRANPDDKTAECVIGLKHGDALYDGISLYGVSPDGQRLAFNRHNRIKKPGDESRYWQKFIFVIDLKEE